MESTFKPAKSIVCAVHQCSNTPTTKPDMAYFAIPLNDRMAQEWIQRILPPGCRQKSNVVCEEHFAEDVIIQIGRTKALKKIALPTNKLPESKISNVAQTDHSASEHKDVFYKLADVMLTKELAILLRTSDCLKYKFSQYKFNEEDFMRFNLKLYQKSPLTYILTQKMLELPEGKILMKEFIKPGTTLRHDTIATIKARVDKMTPRGKNCSLLIKSVPVKANLCYNVGVDKIYGFEEMDGVQKSKPAKTAIVVMIKGILAVWKLLVGYVLIPNDCDETAITVWIDRLLKDLFSIGLNVRTCVLPIKDNWIYKKVVSTETQFFCHHDKKIYLINDASDLIISIRDTLQNRDFHFDNKVATYKDIVKFFKVDQKRDIPYAQKLTEAHINPLNEQKQNVKYAAQIMSKTVAHGLWNYINFGWIKNSENNGSVEFIIRINDLFDTLNVRKRNESNEDNDRKKPISENNTQKDFLQETILFFQNMKVVDPKTGQDVTSRTTSIKNLLISLKSILLLYDDLKTEGNTTLWTDTLQLKSLDYNIKQMLSRLKQKQFKKLTVWQFTKEFNKIFYMNLQKFLTENRRKIDCTSFIKKIQQVKEEMDNDTAFSFDQIANLCLPTKVKEHGAESSSDYVKMIHREDYCELDVEECKYLQHVSEYIVRKVKIIHNDCENTKFYFNPSSHNLYADGDDTMDDVPCDFKDYIQQMDTEFVTAFSNNLPLRIANSLYKEMEDIEYDPPCPCFPTEFLIALFIRIRIFHTIRINNAEYKKNKRSHRSYVVKKLV